ncbi:DNA-binding protein [Thermus scotoductus]|uniref:DNA-binding protein n=1 Tax=Thermus scotoductus TaxID=37636 RepID=A0A430V6B1_THESC|nr:DNA-binding protein [Thermus scotoductus]RTI11662.1 DNA-binding protein [Thermus scotoductus]RTI20389.1 DNA-binding protein [Thermus scotoductus]
MGYTAFVERSRDFILQAKRDLEHARFALEKGFYEWAAFSAQQAAEKAVKAVFQHLGAVAWGHSVLGLLEELAKRHPVSEALLDGASELDKAYIPTRYPDALPEGAPFERYRRPEAERLLRHAEEIYEFCQSLLPPLDPGRGSSAPQGGA